MTRSHGKNKASHWLKWSETQDTIYFQTSKKISSLLKWHNSVEKDILFINPSNIELCFLQAGQPYCLAAHIAWESTSEFKLANQVKPLDNLTDKIIGKYILTHWLHFLSSYIHN